MTNTRLLIANYIDNSLICKLLKKGYEITTINTRIKGPLSLHLPIKKIDLVYFAKFSPPIWDDIDIIFNRTRTPVIYAFHSPLIVFNKNIRLKNCINNAISLIKLAYMKIIKSVTALHVLNTYEYHLLKSLSFKCYYVPLGVDTKKFKPGLKDNMFTVIFVSPRYQKGVDMLIKIVPKVLQKAPDLKFILTGRGFLSQYFISLKSLFGNNVEICERLPQSEFTRLFSSSHILLFPSRYETFGLVVLEALSSGMPVVCYDISGAPRDLVKKYGTGVVASPFNVNQIVNGILGYYEMWKNEPERFKGLSIACRNVASKYDWSIVANLFDDMFRKVLNQKD